MNTNQDINKALVAPMLSVAQNLSYQKPITNGLHKILSRATMLAQVNKEKLIQFGKKCTLKTTGKLDGSHPITFVIYHVPFDTSADKAIGSFDVPTIDHAKIKHLELVRWTIQEIKNVVPEAEIVVCTDIPFAEKIQDLEPSILIPEVEKNRPMYYRAKTYNTIVQQEQIKGTIVFLDSDAIVLKNPINLPSQLNFKVGVTARFAPNLMPVNEGVIIAEAGSQECIDFFAHYMGTYQAIKDDSIVKGITKNDLMRWRGGQLSLNAVCPGSKMLDFRDSSRALKILSCDLYNYTVRDKSEIVDLKREDKVYVAHIKGKAKMS